MKKYLENDLVEFLPLFNIDYNITKNLFCGTFFKLKESYKNFNIYLDGLFKLYYNIIKNYKNYSFRLFIDNSIYNDSEIMKKLKKMNKIELVLFRCLDSKLVGLFPCFTRFFPMFNFPNNDSKIVIIVDIDDNTNPNFIMRKFENIKYHLDNLDKNMINDIYLIKVGNLSRNILFKYNYLYKNNINVYTIAPCIVNIKKINYNVIINFINKIKNTKKLYTTYSYFNYKGKEADIKINQTKPFIYGCDEYFINYTLTKYIINKKLLLINYIKWSLFGNIYYLSEYFFRNILITKTEKNIIKKILLIILNKIDISKVRYTVDKIKNESLEKIINIIDKLIYTDKNKEVMKILYQIFLSNYNNKKFQFIFPHDLSEILLKPEYVGIYDFEKIIFVNSKYKEITISATKINV